MPLLGSMAMDDYTKIYIGKCPECKRRFSYTKHHRYTRTENARKIRYCSYTCFRVKDREDREKEREAFEESCKADERRRKNNEAYRMRRAEQKKQSEPIPAFADRTDVELYLDLAKTRIEFYKKMAISASGSHERYRAKQNWMRWERKRIRVKKVLETWVEEEE